MNLILKRIGTEDAKLLWEMQVTAFMGLYKKYQDTETSPATEPIEKIIMRLEQTFTYYYFIQIDNEIVGAIRIVDEQENEKPKRISPIFVMPEYRNKGIAQKAIREVEKIHGSSNWELDTILQEKGNCHLYEKIGYSQTGETKKINDKMTLVHYKKGENIMKCNSLEEVRANIDRIDNQIIKLIAERGTYVVQASAFKKNEEGVKDTNRVEKVIEKVRDKAKEYGADPDMVEALYREMISRFVNMEMKEFLKKDEH